MIRVVVCGSCLAAGTLCAATLQTIGADSAVALVDRSATFDSLNSTNTQELGNYSEGGLSITTGNQSWAADPPLAARLDPFHGAAAPDRGFFCVAWENLEWTSIRTTNRAVIHGIEFVYGNGWTTGDIFGQYPWGNSDAVLVWQTWQAGTNVSSGSVPFLAMGTIVGFYDPAGFDELLMKATSTASGDTNLNALALDNVSAMLTNIPPAPAIFGGDFSLASGTREPSLTVWDTIPGCLYRMIFTEQFVAPLWLPVTPPSPGGWKTGGGTLTFTDLGAPPRPQRFYRVEVR
jgi:hypothetical protein